MLLYLTLVPQKPLFSLCLCPTMAKSYYVRPALLLLLLLLVQAESRGRFEPKILMPTEKAKLADQDEDGIGTRWAVLVAGSSGYGNYRHQVHIYIYTYLYSYIFSDIFLVPNELILLFLILLWQIFFGLENIYATCKYFFSLQYFFFQENKLLHISNELFGN